jgi:hypothetical protein
MLPAPGSAYKTQEEKIARQEELFQEPVMPAGATAAQKRKITKKAKDAAAERASFMPLYQPTMMGKKNKKTVKKR